MNMITQLPTTLPARKCLVTQILTQRHPEWNWMERIAWISRAHAMLDGGVSVGKVLAIGRKPWEVKL